MTTSELFLALISTLTISMIGTTVGYGLIRIFKLKVAQSFIAFIAFFLGNLIINILFSIVITKGLTIQALLLPLIALGIWLAPKDQQTLSGSMKAVFAPVLIFNLVWSLFYILALWPLINPVDGFPILYKDTYYYTMISESIWKSGNENILNGINFSPYLTSGTSQYHYYELHQNLLQSKPFGLSSAWSFVLSVPTTMAAQGSLLILSILSIYIPTLDKRIGYLIGFILLFIAGFNIIPFEYDEKNNFTSNIINHVSPKYLILYMGLLLITHLIYSRKYLWSFLVFASLPLFTFFTLPVVLGAGILGAFLLLITKTISLNQAILYVSIIMFTSIGLVLFYHFTSVPEEFQRLKINYYDVLMGLIKEPLLFIKRVIGTHVYYPLDYIPFLSLLVVLLLTKGFTKKSLKKNLPLIFYYFLIFEVAIAATWVLFNFHEQAWQTQYYFLGIGTNTLLCWSFILMVKEPRNVRWLYISIVILVCSVKIFDGIKDHYLFKGQLSKKFSKAIEETIRKENIKTIAFLAYDPIYPTVYPVGNFLLNVEPSMRFECIDESIIHSDNVNHKNTTFHQYCLHKKDGQSILDMQSDFMKTYEIDHIISRANNDSSTILKNTTIVAIDTLNNVVIRKLKH